MLQKNDIFFPVMKLFSEYVKNELIFINFVKQKIASLKEINLLTAPVKIFIF